MAEQKILYFDCASGISGDMTLGALLDLGVDERMFLGELEKLHLEGCRIQIRETQKNGIRAKHVDVQVEGVQEYAQEHGVAHEHLHGQETGHGHLHGQDAGYVHPHGQGADHIHEHGAGHIHPHRTYADIRRMIEGSGLSAEEKELSLRIFGRVAAAEAKVHGKPVDEVHFHEVGAVDSIVDIVGCAILICALRPQKICASVVHEGHGTVRCQHGLLSVPVPATSEILAAAQAPLAQIDVDEELVTPTGAAIIAELASSFGSMPPMKVQKIGWGAGTKDLPIPNVLKVYEGTAFADETRREGDAQIIQDAQTLSDEVSVLETNLDDCTGEMLGRAMEVLMEAGALDVFYTPIFMKKNRPAYRLTVLAKPEDERKLEQLIFLHTTTIGVRRCREARTVLRREAASARTPYGELKTKTVTLDGARRAYPEYESAVELAEKNDLSLWEIYRSYE